MATYSELLKDPRWQKKRLEIMQRDNFTCQLCFSSTKTLHVHHLDYVGSYPWDTPDDQLLTVCEGCHKRAEEMKNINKFWASENSMRVIKIMDEMLDNQEFFESIFQFYKVKKTYQDKREQGKILKEDEDLI